MVLLTVLRTNWLWLYFSELTIIVALLKVVSLKYLGSFYVFEAKFIGVSMLCFTVNLVRTIVGLSMILVITWKIYYLILYFQASLFSISHVYRKGNFVADKLLSLQFRLIQIFRRFLLSMVYNETSKLQILLSWSHIIYAFFFSSFRFFSLGFIEK